MIPVWWSVLLTAMGGLGWLLVTVDRRIQGFMWGLLAQLAWISYAVVTGQWGFIASALLFGAINVLGLVRLRRAGRERARVEARNERLWREANPGCTCLWHPVHGHERLCPAWSPPAQLRGLLDHSDTAAMQRADGERFTPPVFPATDREPRPRGD